MIRWTIAATVVSSLLLLSSPVLAGDAPAGPRGDFDAPQSGDCRDQIGFADALRGEGDYYRAVTEYKRALHFCRDDSLSARARAGVGETLFEAGRYGLVMDWYRELDSDGADLHTARLLAGRALFRLERYYGAVDLLQAPSRDGATSVRGSAAHYYIGLSRIRMGELDLAQRSFALVEDFSSYAEKSGRHLDVLRDVQSPPRKSPRVAAALAIVPGAGYAYAEHYGTAVASVIVNGLLGWATVNAFRDGNNGAGGFCAVLALGFYVGNITGSAQSADRYNTYQEERFQAKFPE
jgi:tetratricopeptide (TPR) repeat protein